MTDFERHGLDDDAFGEKSGLSAFKSFDAFRMPVSDIEFQWPN